MEFLVLAVASATPEDLFLPSPVPVQAWPGSSFQAPLPALERNLVVFSVVPDSSERKKTVMFALGSLASELSFAIFGSFQVLIVPLKISESTSAFSTSLSTPSTLEAKGFGPTPMGRFQAGLFAQRSLALSASITPSFSSVLSAESEPAKSTRPL